MPEAGQTPQASFKQGDLAYGEAAQVNDLVGLLPPQDEQNFKPAAGAEDFLFSPTDRPDEPFSHGLPFGPGAAVTPGAREDDDQLVMRVAKQVQADPAAPKVLRQFAQRAAQGI